MGTAPRMLAAAVILFSTAAVAQDPETSPGSVLSGNRPYGLSRSDNTLDPLKDALSADLAASTLGQLRSQQDYVTRGPLEIKIFASWSPAVVLVANEVGGEMLIGSGSLIDANGLILTNWHVTGSSAQVAVVFKSEVADVEAGKRSLRVARVLATDELRDLALIKVDQPPSQVRPIQIGDSSILQVGADVHAIGHPTGATWTYTRGFVSQIRPGFQWEYADKKAHKADVIQTQTPIAPGSSGGPLLDDDGRLMGINSFGKQDGKLINYAVASGEVRTFLDRYAKSKVSKARPPQPSCDSRVVFDGFDNRHPQYVRIVRYDRNCDSESDAALLISKNPRSANFLVLDTRGTGYIDTVIVDRNRDSKWDISYYDQNGDRKFDLIGQHDDGSLIPSRYSELRPPATYAQIVAN